ncbi:MAG: pitrilysin family protein [Pseudomonadota bacterium]
MFLLLTSVLAAGPALAADGLDYTLPNGLRVILLENHRAPVTSMLVWVKVGSVSEKKGEYGLAHLMEHMMFKGTVRRGPGEIAREVESSGGEINAYTSFDQTVYYINMASRFQDKGLEILGDMVFDAVFDPAEFSKEKEVVLEELRRGEDEPGRRISTALFSKVFREHPLRPTGHRLFLGIKVRVPGRRPVLLSALLPPG